MSEFPFEFEEENKPGSEPELPSAASGCPSPVELEQYLAGLVGNESQDWGVHLQNCPLCRSVFEQDKLLRSLFGTLRSDPFLTELSQSWQPDLSGLASQEATLTGHLDSSPALPEPVSTAMPFFRADPKPHSDLVPLLPVELDEIALEQVSRRKARRPWQRWYATLAAGLVVGLLGLTLLSLLNTASHLPNVTSQPVGGPIKNPHSKFEFEWKVTDFTRPGGVAVDEQGQLYVADEGKHYIQKLDSTGRAMNRLGSYGTGNGQFSFPRGLALDRQGNLYVADTSNNRVQKITGQGQWLSGWGQVGNADSQFYLPWNIALDSVGNVYVTDSGNNRIQKFDSEGHFLLKWGANGEGDGQFDVPTGITIDSHDNVYVVDSNHNRVQKFDSGGGFLLKWGESGEGEGQFQLPQGLAVDGSDQLYVVDSGNNRLQKFDSQGRFLFKWDNSQTPGTSRKADGQLNGPEGIAIDRQGNVYLTDTQNARLEKFGQP